MEEFLEANNIVVLELSFSEHLHPLLPVLVARDEGRQQEHVVGQDPYFGLLFQIIHDVFDQKLRSNSVNGYSRLTTTHILNFYFI
jgi:hypothetical protein